MNVRIAGLVHESVTDGPGLRTTVFFQGCPHTCPGCHNPHTRSFSDGRVFDVEALLATFRVTPLLSGFTFSGGEPFAQAVAAAQIAEHVKARQMDLWVYTGYVWEELLKAMGQPGYRDLIRLADVLVDGPYRQELRDLSLPYRGSSNQRIILPHQSQEQNRVVVWERHGNDIL